MLKKIAVIVLCLIGIEFNFLNFASAELRLVDTDKNGYKTYFDTDSLGAKKENGQTIIFVRIVGYRPDNSKILDVIEKFKAVENELYISVKEGEWVKGKESSYKIWWAILSYVNEVASSRKNK